MSLCMRHLVIQWHCRFLPVRTDGHEYRTTQMANWRTNFRNLLFDVVVVSSLAYALVLRIKFIYFLLFPSCSIVRAVKNEIIYKFICVLWVWTYLYILFYPMSSMVSVWLVFRQPTADSRHRTFCVRFHGYARQMRSKFLYFGFAVAVMQKSERHDHGRSHIFIIHCKFYCMPIYLIWSKSFEQRNPIKRDNAKSDRRATWTWTHSHWISIGQSNEAFDGSRIDGTSVRDNGNMCISETEKAHDECVCVT